MLPNPSDVIYLDSGSDTITIHTSPSAWTPYITNLHVTTISAEVATGDIKFITCSTATLGSLGSIYFLPSANISLLGTNVLEDLSIDIHQYSTTKTCVLTSAVSNTPICTLQFCTSNDMYMLPLPTLITLSRHSKLTMRRIRKSGVNASQLYYAEHFRRSLPCSDERLYMALQSNIFPNIHVSTSALADAIKTYGVNPARQIALMKKYSGQSHSQFEEPSSVGERLYIDVIIRANTIGLASVDGFSSYFHCVFSASKSADDIYTAIQATIGLYNANDHKIELLVADDEKIFTSLSHRIQSALHVRITTTTPGRHNRFFERYWQSITDNERINLASIPFNMHPNHPFMERSCLLNAIQMHNIIPNSRTGPHTVPYTLLTKQPLRHTIDQLHKFGTPVLARDLNNSRSNDPNRTNYGLTMFMDLQNPARHYIYFPDKKGPPLA